MPIGNEMTREHDVLRSELSSLPGLLQGGGLAEMHALLAQRVGLLDDSMRRHFANAERGGSLDVVTTQQPGMASHVSRRRERLGRHAIAEYDLMQWAVRDDLGTGD